MWTATKSLFMCDEDKKTFVLRDCKTRWKDFKSKLSAAYFTNEEKNDEVNKPWEDYVGIDEEDWKELKRQRLDPEFKHELMDAQKDGEFVSGGSHDILTEALGTPERGGYVRGLGGKATVTAVFKRKKRSCNNEGTMTLKQVEEFAINLTQQVREQTRDEMKEVTLELLKTCGIQIPDNVELNMISNINFHDSTLRLTNRSSCHSVDHDPFANGSKEPKPCKMSVLDENVGYRVVAKGTLSWTESGELVHNVPLQNDHVKVKILQVLKGEEQTSLPVPFLGL